MEVEGEYGGNPIRLDMVRVRLAKEVKVKDRRIVELTQRQVYWYGMESLPTSSVSHAGDTGSSAAGEGKGSRGFAGEETWTRS